jgi:RsiW-degrading membrane proteinase PrsW (M82 family)
MDFYLFFALGILPSLIWLLYFLEKDNDPEPKKMIVLAFVLGALGAGIACVFQGYLREMIMSLNGFKPAVVAFLNSFLAISFLEETSKFLAASVVFVLGVRNIDEPVDFMIYMITAGLGFAAFENYLYFSNAAATIVAELIFLRFAITTLFHALSAGILGYFISQAVKTRSDYLIFTGLITVTFLHTLYNALIELMSTTGDLFYSSFLLVFIFLLTLVLVKGFTKTKEMKSICDCSFLTKDA